MKSEKYGAEMRRRWADPAYRALMSQRLSAGQRRRFKDPEQRASGPTALRKWRRNNPEKFKAVQQELATRPHPTKSMQMKERWAHEPTARQMLGVIGTNHQPEYLDAKGRLWRFKSTWEEEFAFWLDDHALTWAYEPCVLLLSDGRRYFPDFWVQEWATYIELKARHRSTEKADLAKQDGHPVMVLQGLKEIRAFMAAKV